MSDDEHRINRARDAPTETDGADEDGEPFTCDECGRTFEDEVRYREHVDRERRETLRGSPLGEAFLGFDKRLRDR